jgi:hypothetical protein
LAKVKFLNVGRNKISWEAECDGEPTYEWMFGQVKKALLSNDIDFTDNGEILAGFRTVGEFEVED